MESQQEPIPNINEEIIMMDQPIKLRGGRPDKLKIVGKKKKLGKIGLKAPNNPKPKPKQSNADFLIDTIVKTYWSNKWKQQLIAMKYSRIGFNKKRSNFRSLCTALNKSMKYHQYIYLIKLFDKMEKLPAKPEVKHDELFGKIKLKIKRII